LSKLSSAYFNTQNYEKALEVKNKEINNFPYNGGDWKSVGEIYEQMNKKKDAISAYNKAIYYSPNDYDTRRKIRKLDGKKDVYSYFSPMDIPEKIRKSTPKDSFPGDALHIVNFEVQRVIYPEGGDEEKINLIIQVLNDEGIDAVKEYSVGAVDNNQYAEIEKAEIIKLNGSKIDGDISGTDIVFTGLEVGDWISITYKYINYRSGKLLEHFWGKFYFDYYYPTQNAKYQLLVPKTKKFDYTVTNDGIKPTIKEADEFNLYTWEKKNAPKIKSENLMPVSGDFSDVLHLSSIPDWKFVAEWYRDLANQSDFIDPTVSQAVKEALKDIPNGTNDQKVKAIYEYIINNISYSQVPFRQGPYIPQEPAKVLDSRLGDCKDVSSLFVKMTKEAGINSQLVLVNTRDNGRKTMLLPSIDFNHCIAKTTYQNKEAFLELTSKYISFLTTPYSLDEAQILPIPSKGEAAPANLAVSNLKQSIIPNKVFSKTHVIIKGNQLDVEKKSKYTANFATNYRSGYRNISKEEIEKGLLEQTTSIYSGSVKLQSFLFENLDNLEDTLILTKKFTVANAVNKVGSLNIIPLNWSDKEPNLNFLAEDTRSYLLDYKIRNLTDYDEEEITISTSKGEKFVEIPENAIFTFDNQITYTYTYKLENNVLKAKRTVKVTSFDILPERYAAFKEFFAKIVEEDNKQIGFK
jgi:tetratricopeptide (TPR) repeat protein